MKKTLSMLLVLAMLVALFAACGSTAASVAETAAEAGSAAEAAVEDAAEEVADAAEDAAEAVEGAVEDAAEAVEEEIPEEEQLSGDPLDAMKEEFISYPLEGDNTISIWYYTPPYVQFVDSNYNFNALKAAEEATGVKLEFIEVGSASASEQFNLMVEIGRASCRERV